jgi:hypothetical protein
MAACVGEGGSDMISDRGCGIGWNGKLKIGARGAREFGGGIMLGIAIDRGGIEIGGGCNEGGETDGGRVVSPCEEVDSGLVSCISFSSSAENFLFIFHKRKRSKRAKGGV